MKPAPFKRIVPLTVDEAITALVDNPGASILAGGQSLIPTMALRLATPEILVDLQEIGDLATVAPRSDGALRIGAMTTQSKLLSESLLATSHPVVARTIPLIGHPAIRNRGTVGGSLAHSDPAAEWPALAKALDAQIELAGPDGRRVLSAEEFFLGPMITALGPDELITAVTIPPFPERAAWGVVEVARRQGDVALAGAIVVLSVSVGWTITRSRVALFAIGSRPQRFFELEERLTGALLEGGTLDAVENADFRELEYASDIHVSTLFRKHLARVVTRRAIEDCLQQMGIGRAEAPARVER